MFDLHELYQEIVMDHNRHPRNFRELQGDISTAEGFNPLCGDQVKIYIRLKNEQISDISFQGSGCAISKASASMLTDTINGMTVKEATETFESFRNMLIKTPENQVTDELPGDLSVLSGVSQYPARIKCAVLAWHTLASALHGKKKPITTE